MLGQAEEVLPSIVNKILMVSVFPFLYIFLFGVMCYLHREKLMPIYQKVCVPLCIIYVIWNILPDKITSEIGGVRYNVVTTILLMPIVMSLGYKFKKHRVRNELSYHFYLYHMVVINFFVQNFERPDSKISMALYFVSTFGITILFAIFSQKVVDGVISKRIRSKLFLRGENKKWLHRR